MEIIEKVRQIASSIIAFFAVYLIIFFIGVTIIEYMGFSELNIFNIGLSIFFASYLSFIATYLIGIIYKLIPFMDYEQYETHFHIVHHIIIYFSGLVSLLAAISPYMSKELGTTLAIREDYLFLFGIVFFISISNYNIYNSIVFDNVFGSNIEKSIVNGIMVILNITQVTSLVLFGLIWYKNLELGVQASNIQVMLLFIIIICIFAIQVLKKRNLTKF